MSRKYSSWASDQSLINPDMQMLKLATVTCNEQSQIKNLDRVEAVPHMYINVDVPPPPPIIPAPPITSTPVNTQTKMWPMEKPKNASTFESVSSASKRTHKHKHHHHHRHHHGDKHHHRHHHHGRRNRATSAEAIRNRPNQTVVSTSKIITANPQYSEQDQQQPQQQQQQMIIYREVPNGEGYTVDSNSLATVPYETQNGTAVLDDQQAPVFVYRDGNFQPQTQSIVTDGIPQQVFYSQDQDGNFHQRHVAVQPIQNPHMCSQTPRLMNKSPCINTGCNHGVEPVYVEPDSCCCVPSTHHCISKPCFIQQTDRAVCLPQQQASQIVYCTDPHQQDFICASANNNIVQQTISPSPAPQQFVCVDNTPAAMQPTVINQMPVFNALSTTAASGPSVISLPNSPLQHTTSFLVQQPQAQPLQLIQQPQPVQVIQQPQQLQVIQQPQQLQVIQQPQPLQVIQSPQPQSAQILQIAPAAPQVIQAQPVLQTVQIPAQAIAASPQILYQRPYDPVVIPVQNQPTAVASPNLVALSQPSYAPSRVVSASQPSQSDGANMFRQALLRTVSGRTGVPIPSTTPATGGIQLAQPVAIAPAVSNNNLVLAGGANRSASLPIVPLTAGGLLIPFQSGSQGSELKSHTLPRAGDFQSRLLGFNDIRQQMEQQRVQLAQQLRQATLDQQRSSPPVISAPSTTTNPTYSSGNIFGPTRSPGGPNPPIISTTYSRPAYSSANAGVAGSGGYFRL